MSAGFIKDKNTEKGLNFSCSNWLRLNFTYLFVGVGIGLILSLLISAFKGEWLGSRSFAFQILFSTIITLCITNCIHISQKLFKFSREKIWLFITVYYLASITGMLIAIELSYLIRAWLFNIDYHFFHLQDATFSVIVVVIVCTIIYVYHAKKASLNAKIQERDIEVVKLSQMKTQAELATLQSKINPHFLYNSLNAIASLIHEDPDKAESMTLKLSKLFRYSINQNQENMVQVREEMEIVSTYLDIEKVRFSDRINFTIEVDPELLDHKIPRFLIQPLVENALKHGLKDVIDNGELNVKIQRTGDMIIISISDNGVPFPEELETGYGLQSMYDRLGLIYNNQNEVQITNQPSKQIRIQIPFINE